MTEATKYRCVVSWAGPDQLIKLTLYGPAGEVASMPLTPTRALTLAKDLTEPAVSEIKFRQWGSAE